MFSPFRWRNRDKRYQDGLQMSTNMSLGDDEDQATLVGTYHGCDSTEQQPTDLPANPDEHAAEAFLDPLIIELEPAVSLVLDDLDFVMDRLQKVREGAFRRQTDAGCVLRWGRNANFILQQEARSKGKPRPPVIDPSEVEEKMQQDLADLEVLQGDLGGQVQAAQDVYDQVQRLRRGYPTLSPDYNFLSEHQLQERLALFDGQEHALQQQTMSLHSTYQRLKNCNRSPAAPTSENCNARQSKHRYPRHLNHQ